LHEKRRTTMSRFGTVLAILLSASLMVWSACDGPAVSNSVTAMFRGNPEHTGVFETRGVEQLGSVLWLFETMGPVRSSPTVAGETVYVGSTDGHLYAIDRRSGQERWRVDVESPVSSSPAVTGGLVIFGSRDGVFHAVEARAGALRWQFETGGLLPWEWGFEGWDIYTSSPVVSDSLVVFGAGDGIVYAVDIVTGRELWRFGTEGRIRSTPAVADGVVFIGSTDGVVYALDLKTGDERWRHETDGAGMRSEEQRVDRKSIIASPAVSHGTVYVGSRDGYMYALDRETGDRRWRIGHDGSWAMSSAAVVGDALYSGTSDGRFVHSVDAARGEERWRFVGAGYTWSSPSIAGSTIYIGDGGGYLRAIDRASGEEHWSYRVGDGVYSSPAIADGVVFFGSDDGIVYALHGEGQHPRHAVYWDEQFVDYTIFPHLETKVYFEQAGYLVLDSETLGRFMESRIEDRVSSVVVFAMDHLPEAIATEPSDTVLFRRYLDSGGKVVWLGLPPMSLTRDETGRITSFDRGRSAALLGVDHAESNFDFYATAPTDLGRSWGLHRGWVSSYAVAASNEIEILGIDENGRAGAWVKSFGGSTGTGFVGMGLDRATPPNLDIVRRVAEYGLGQSTPAAR
jgi:outer membrane protein assembly factor BamB